MDSQPGPSHNPPPQTPAIFYWEVDAELGSGDEPLWGLFLAAEGAQGAQILDEGNERLRVRYYFDHLDETAAREWPRSFLTAYPDAGAPQSFTLTRKPRSDWATAWRESFAPLAVGRRLLIRPPWPTDSPLALHGRLELVIDPGQGFGTGRHPTTALMLEALEELVPRLNPTAMLDIGTGSGILAIAGRLLGVPRVDGLDIDGRAVREVGLNFGLNGLEPPRMVLGGAECLSSQYPLVIANLVTPVLVAEAGHIAGRVTAGGGLVLSGILETEAEQVLRAFREQGCHLEAERQKEGWCALHLRKEAAA